MTAHQSMHAAHVLVLALLPACLLAQTEDAQFKQVPDLGARTWDGYRDPLNEKMIQLIEEKDPAYAQENQLKALIADGASPSYLGEYNSTGLMWAAVRHKVDLARILLDSGADTESVNAWGRNAMFIAAWEQQDEIVSEMIAAGANVSAGAQHDEWTALHKAAEMGNVAMVRMLLDAGADPTKRTLPDSSFPKGVTPMAITKSKEVKRVLKPAIAEVRRRRAAESGGLPAAPPPPAGGDDGGGDGSGQAGDADRGDGDGGEGSGE